MDFKYKVSYKTELLTENSMIRPDGFSCLSFRNQGESNVIINRSIKIAPGESLFINEKPIVSINSDMIIHFTGQGLNELVVIYSFYEEA